MTFTKEDLRIQNEGSWTMKTVLFADGQGGAATQVQWAYWAPQPLGSPVLASDLDPTPIAVVWSRKSRKDVGRTRVFYDESEVTDMEQARSKWKAEGRPTREPADPNVLLHKAS